MLKTNLRGMVGKPLTEEDCDFFQNQWEENDNLKKQVNDLKKELNESRRLKIYQIDDSTLILLGEEPCYLHFEDGSIVIKKLDKDTTKV